MKSVDKKLELNRHRDILLATIDYMLEKIEAENLPPEGLKAATDYYEQQKQLIEKYYLQNRLDRLIQKLHTLTMYPRVTADLSFGNYINKRTGHDIDIFESLQKRMEEIIGQNQLECKKDLEDVSIMLEVYKQKPGEQEKLDILKSIILDFVNRQKERNKGFI